MPSVTPQQAPCTGCVCTSTAPLSTTRRRRSTGSPGSACMRRVRTHIHTDTHVLTRILTYSHYLLACTCAHGHTKGYEPLIDSALQIISAAMSRNSSPVRASGAAASRRAIPWSRHWTLVRTYGFWAFVCEGVRTALLTHAQRSMSSRCGATRTTRRRRRCPATSLSRCAGHLSAVTSRCCRRTRPWWSRRTSDADGGDATHAHRHI